MFNPARMRTGSPVTNDPSSSTRTDTETTVVPAIVGYSDSTRDLRLRLRFGDRELVADRHPTTIIIGRAEENDVVIKGRLSSRLHACIVLGRSNFVLIDQSTNGTFVQTGDGEQLFIRHDIRQLKGEGMIGLGCPPERDSPHTIHFICDDQLVCTARSTRRLEPRDQNRRSERKPSESQLSLQRALRTLRAVRQRYETGRNAHPDARSYSVNVAVDHGDLAWITAAIEAVAKAIIAGTAESAGPTAEARHH